MPEAARISIAANPRRSQLMGMVTDCGLAACPRYHLFRTIEASEYGTGAGPIDAHVETARAVQRAAGDRSPMFFSQPESAHLSASNSSIALPPAMIVPSMGTLSPGRTGSTSPTLTSTSGIVSVLSVASTLTTVLGARSKQGAASNYMLAPTSRRE